MIEVNNAISVNNAVAVIEVKEAKAFDKVYEVSTVSEVITFKTVKNVRKQDSSVQ